MNISGKITTVSVIIPAFNSESTIVSAIRSVLAQTYDNTEIIVIDDASKDNTVEVINKSFPQELNIGKIILVEMGENTGSSGARNKGIRVSRGQLIAFLDSDDIWLPDKLQKQLDRLIETGADACFCQTAWIENNRVLKVTTVENTSVSFENGGPTSTWVMRRDVFEKIGYFDEDFPANVDGEFLVRFNKSCSSCFVYEPLYQHYYHPFQISFSSKNKIIGWEKMLGKHLEIFNAEEKSAAYFNLAVFYLIDDQKKLNYVIKAIRNKRTLKSIILFMLLLIPSAGISKWFLNKALDVLHYPKSFAGRYKKKNE